MRSCASAAAAASFKPFPASADSGRVYFIHGVESHIELLRFRVLRRGNPPNSFFLRRNPVHLVRSSSSSESHVAFESADEDKVQLQLSDKDSSWMVHVRLQLQRECRFGEQYLVAGDHPTLGLWGPSDATPMVWSHGHVWTAELDLPVGQLIQFKFILKETSGKIQWQPGPNRFLQTWKTSDIIRVFGDWEDVTVQHVTKENDMHNQYVESDEVMIDEMRKLREYGDVASFNGQAMAMVAENITNHTAEISENGVVAKKAISHTLKDEIDISNNIIDINGETDPVLVPGLSSCLAMETEPKLDQKQDEDEEEEEEEVEEEARKYGAKEEVITELILNKEHVQIQHMNKPALATSDEKHQGLELTNFRKWDNKDNDILHSSIKWCQETLRIFFNNLGFGFRSRAIK